MLTADELLIEFIKQYHGVATDAVAEALRQERQWTWESVPEVTPAHVRQGYILISVLDRTLTPGTPEERASRRQYFRSLPRSEQAQIHAEVDREFWERTQYRPGQRLGRSRDDRVMAQYWLRLRDEFIRRRQAIDALPANIRALLFSETATRRLQPRDYEAVLRIANKLLQLSDSELEAYRARTTSRTSDLSTFEASIDRYIAEVQERRAAVEEREQAKRELYGLEEVYRRYRQYRSLLSGSTGSAIAGRYGGGGLGASLGMQPTLNRAREELTASLRRYGFSSISDFERAIAAFVAAYRSETVLIGKEMLDRYEHVLWEQEERYRRASEAAGLHRQLEPARQHYRQAIRIREEHAMTPWTPEEMAEQAYWSGQFRAEQARGRAAIEGLSGTHPLLRNRDVPHEELALADRDDVQSLMLDYIAERRDDVRETRSNLESHPDMVFELDVLRDAAFAEQNIRPGSIYAMIIEDHVRQTEVERAMINLAIAVLAIAAGFLSAGTGTVAVLGATAGLGLSAYQAVEEFRRYEQMSAAAGAQLLSDDPSFAWVIVAIVGAGIDLGGAAAALRGAGGFRAAVAAFNETGDVGALRASLENITALEERIRANILRAAELEAQSRAAWRSVVRPPTVLRAVIVPGAEEFGRLVYAVYLSVRRGILSFERFVLTREAIDLIGDVARLAPEDLTLLKSGFAQALSDTSAIIRHGRSLGMADNEIHAFVRGWHNNPSHTLDEITEQMDRWAEPLRRSQGARYRVASDLMMDAETRALLSDFDQRVAGTGGIERIRARRTDEGRLSITVEGEVRPGELVRDPRRAQPGDRIAPSFNADRSNLLSRSELGLSDDWERLHLWGPGFGDEAAAGMMWGPREINQLWQNRGVEDYIRTLASQARQQGGNVRVRATAIAWENPTPRGWSAPGGDLFLKQAEYRITVELPGRQPQSIRATIDVAEPPATRAVLSIDPPAAFDPAALLGEP